MPTLGFDQIANLGKEEVIRSFDYIGETEAPLFKYFYGRGKKTLREQGIRMPMIVVEPGGHTLYAQGSSDFRAPIPMDSDSARVYPVNYSLAHQVNGASLRAMRSADEGQLLKWTTNVGMLTKVSKKRLNIYMHGDGIGTLAVCGSIITGNGSTTLTCLTLATSGAGDRETKGAILLKKGHTYATVNASTGALRHTFTVTTPSKTAPTVTVANFTSNSASGDPIVDIGGTSGTATVWKKAPQGIRSLAAATGVVQNIDRSSYFEWKTPRVNGQDLPITPYVFATAKTYVDIAANNVGEATGRLIVMTAGQHTMLRIQQFGYRHYDGNENVRGVAGKYIDQDGDTMLFDGDAAEDRVYILDGNSYYLGEEKPFGIFDEDSLEMRMLAGVNSVGSDSFALAIGWGGNLIKDLSSNGFQRDAYIDRLSQTDVPQQTSF
jgi:hypothetical protein